MSNEYPPRPTEMCEPVISDTTVVSDIYYNKLNKAIDEYWKSKYPKFATGRIKRMRKGESKCNCILRRIHSTSIVITGNELCFNVQVLHKITRWNRH